MRSLILGTAGHIDHGKTALVKSLTGVDTDRLKEEKERGITVDLGFAEFSPDREVRFGVVDVPGHEGFVRNMVAGATGLDLVLLVVAADEGVMPQTREHLAIVRLLGVPRLLVALTKCDMVDSDWLELVTEDVRDLLASTPYGDAPIVPTSAKTGMGLDELANALSILAGSAEEKGSLDEARLPIDRVFTVRGAGTVVTGTLWSGILAVGDRIEVLPGGLDGRIRSVQVHGRDVPQAEAGVRVAVSLAGPKLNHRDLFRGQALVKGNEWESSRMLTAWTTVLPDTGWVLEQGQRIRLHLGTAERLARATVFGVERIPEGGEGWVQFRLEEPLLARVRDRFVIRSYSPVTTIGGGWVAEVLPRKRRHLGTGEGEFLRERLEAPPETALLSLLRMSGWKGTPEVQLPQRTGLPPSVLEGAIERVLRSHGARRIARHLVSDTVWREGVEALGAAVDRYHMERPLQPGLPLEEARQVLPGPLAVPLTDAILESLEERGLFRIHRGVVSASSFRPQLTRAQQTLRERLAAILQQTGLAPPTLKELKAAESDDVEGVLRLMEADGQVRAVDAQTFFWQAELDKAGSMAVEAFGGRSGMGPADFREVLPLTRKHLLPLLRYFDTVGITTRKGDTRTVSESLPAGWGTPKAPKK